MSIGFTEIIVILIVVLLLFGSKRIPELARALGRASQEFKKAKDAVAKEGEELMNTAEKPADSSTAATDKEGVNASSSEKK